MRKYILFAVFVAVLLFVLLRVFGSGISITVGAVPQGTATLTHEEELRAPYETAKAELKTTP